MSCFRWNDHRQMELLGYLLVFLCFCTNAEGGLLRFFQPTSVDDLPMHDPRYFAAYYQERNQNNRNRAIEENEAKERAEREKGGPSSNSVKEYGYGYLQVNGCDLSMIRLDNEDNSVGTSNSDAPQLYHFEQKCRSLWNKRLSSVFRYLQKRNKATEIIAPIVKRVPFQQQHLNREELRLYKPEKHSKNEKVQYTELQVGVKRHSQGMYFLVASNEYVNDLRFVFVPKRKKYGDLTDIHFYVVETNGETHFALHHVQKVRPQLIEWQGQKLVAFVKEEPLSEEELMEFESTEEDRITFIERKTVKKEINEVKDNKESEDSSSSSVSVSVSVEVE